MVKFSWNVGLLYVVVVFLITCEGAYVPGQPGAQWTEQQAKITMEKILRLMYNPRKAISDIYNGITLTQYDDLAAQARAYKGIQRNFENIWPDMPKFIRLAFHDCVREKDGVTGCNGCLNFKGVDDMFSSEECAPDCNDVHGNTTYGKSQRPYATFDANNNQLRFLGLILEEVYINPAYPPGSTELAESLQSSGISRADLWAFSSLVGLKYAEFLNNDACRRDDPGNGNGKDDDCHYHIRKGDSDCEITLPEIRFQTGRIDCTKHCTRTEPFCTRSEEIHPNPQMNGAMIIDFLSTNTPKENSFNIRSEGAISRREAVALMGVHALGRPHPVNSLFSGYEWTKVQSTFLNNEYYRNMLDYKAYIPFCGGSVPWTRMGDAEGNKVQVSYQMKSEKRTNSGGPYIFRSFAPGCDQKKCDELDELDQYSCCRYIRNNNNPDFVCSNEICKRMYDAMQNPKNVKKYGEKMTTNHYWFATQMQMSPDFGLVKEFGVDMKWEDNSWTGTGKPIVPNKRLWLQNLEDSKVDVGGITSANMSRQYAEDNETWLKDFAPAFEKMLRNGYSSHTKNELIDGPTDWFKADIQSLRETEYRTWMINAIGYSQS